MSIYISPANEYPRFQGDIKLDVPSWNPGDDLPEGWSKVEEAEVPTPTADQVVEEEFPIQKDGIWYRSYKVRAMTAAEKARRDAPKTAKAKLLALGLTEVEVEAIVLGLVR